MNQTGTSLCAGKSSSEQSTTHEFFEDSLESQSLCPSVPRQRDFGGHCGKPGMTMAVRCPSPATREGRVPHTSAKSTCLCEWYGLGREINDIHFCFSSLSHREDLDWCGFSGYSGCAG